MQLAYVLRISRVGSNGVLRHHIVGKVEYMSAGGSVKDRIAKRMVEGQITDCISKSIQCSQQSSAAEQEGKLVPGKSIVIEPTSGNTGKLPLLILASVIAHRYSQALA